MKKHKEAAKKKKTNKLRHIILVSSLLLGLCLNIFQAFLYKKTQDEANDVTWRLDNYRQLQVNQINAVTENCNKVTDAYTKTLYRYYNVINLYDNTLANSYLANIRLRCKIPALTIAGYTEGEYEENVKQLFEDGTLKIKSDAFNEVRW